MKFNLATRTEAENAFQHLTDLVGKDAVVDIVKVSPKRSLNQNNYLHLLLSYWGSQNGFALAEAKVVYKTVPGNVEIYVHRKKVFGEDRLFLGSSKDLTKEEMQKSIDRFMMWSEEHGTKLPAANDEEFMRWAENESERHRQFL